MLEANPTRLFRLLAAQPGLGAALVAAAVTEAADAAEMERACDEAAGAADETEKLGFAAWIVQVA